MMALASMHHAGRYLRLYSDDYGGEIQAQYVQQEFGMDAYLSLLRFDSLTSRRLIIADNQLFDSPYLLGRRPAELAKDLGRDTLPFIIRSRMPTLGQSLTSFIVRPDSDLLSDFDFYPIRNAADRSLVRTRLSRTTVNTFDRILHRCAARRGKNDVHTPAIALATLLRQRSRGETTDQTQDDIDQLERGWSWWLEEERATLEIEQWQPYGPPLLSRLLGPPPVVATEFGKRVLCEVLAVTRSGATYRNDIEHLLRRHLSDVTDDRERADLEAVRMWYIQGRHKRVMAQHNCNYGRRLDVLPPNSGTGQAQDLVGLTLANCVHPPSRFMGTLRAMPAEQFRTLFAACIDDLRRWWTVGDAASLARTVGRIDPHGGTGTGARDPENWLDAAQIFVNTGVVAATDSALLCVSAAALALVSTIRIPLRERSRFQGRQEMARILECAQRRFV